MSERFDKLAPSRRHRRTGLISTVASCVAICAVILPAAGWALSPLIGKYLSESMADEIQRQVHEQVTPIAAGFKVLIQANIAELEDEISALEYKRSTQTGWTQLDAQLLTMKMRRLGSQKEALQALVAAERSLREQRRP